MQEIKKWIESNPEVKKFYKENIESGELTEEDI